MRGAMLAEWIRLRGRRDLWFAAVAGILAAGFFFISSYFSSIGHLEFSSSSAMSGALEGEAAALRAPFAFPQSLLTVLDGAWPATLAAAYLGFATVGAEFALGTVRPSLIAARSRRVFLGARCLALLVISAAILVAITLLGALLPVVLTPFGGPMPSVPWPSIPGLAGELGARLLAALALASLGTCFALLTRSLIAGTLATIVYLLFEAILVSSTRSGSLAIVGQLSLSGSTTSVIENAHRVAGAVLPVDESARLVLQAQPLVAPVVSLAVALGWIAALLIVSFAAFDRTDVTD